MTDENQATHSLVLARISVIGFNADQEIALRNAIPFRIGEELTLESIRLLRKRLGETNALSNSIKVQIVPGERQEATVGAEEIPFSHSVELKISKPRNVRISEIGIFPLIPISVERLRSVCPIFPGDEYNQQAVEGAVMALRAEGRKLGFNNLHVEVFRIALTTETMALGLMLEGSHPVRLEKVKFIGAGGLGWIENNLRIRAFLRKLEPVSFDTGASVTALLLRKVEVETAAFMQAQGYIRAQVRLLGSRVDEKGLEVAYEIRRGPRFRISPTRVMGKRIPEPGFWKESVEPFNNKYLTAKTMRELEESVERQAQSQGFMAPQIEFQYEPSDLKRKIAVTANVDEGTTSVLGAVIVDRKPPERGYGSTRYHQKIAPPVENALITRQVRALSGELLNRRVLDDVSRRLWSFGFFDTVEVKTTATGNIFVRDLVAQIKEKRTGSFAATLGLSDTIGPVGRLTFSENNVGGRADNLMMELNSQREGYGGAISYFNRNWKAGERWMGSHREPSLLWSAFSADRKYDEYVETREGAGVGLEYLIGGGYSLWSNSWQARLEEISYSPFGSAEDYSEKFNSYLAATIAYRLTYDSRNRGEANSTRGFLFDSSLETGAADGFLLKWINRADWHYPISSHWGWLTRAQLGLMPVDAREVGLSDRFHAGGVGNLRGFEFRGIGPVDEKNSRLHTGGATLFTVQNEMRYIMNNDFEVPAFLDVGTVVENPYRVGDLRASAGIGARFTIPFLNQPAYFYYSQNLMARDSDNEKAFQFGFSVKFKR